MNFYDFSFGMMVCTDVVIQTLVVRIGLGLGLGFRVRVKFRVRV